MHAQTRGEQRVEDGGTRQGEKVGSRVNRKEGKFDEKIRVLTKNEQVPASGYERSLLKSGDK